jgi:DNA-binding XRE family transcriptional regulator
MDDPREELRRKLQELPHGSIANLAKEVGISRNSLQMVKTGRRDPRSGKYPIGIETAQIILAYLRDKAPIARAPRPTRSHLTVRVDQENRVESIKAESGPINETILLLADRRAEVRERIEELEQELAELRSKDESLAQAQELLRQLPDLKRG